MGTSIVDSLGPESRPARRRWLGGYIHRQANGADLFIIEKKVRGKKYHVSTRCHTERPALQQLALFEADPVAYARNLKHGGSSNSSEPITINAQLIDEWWQYQVDEKRNTKKHADEMIGYLADWREALGDRDLKMLDLGADIVPALKRWKTSRPHRIIAIKSFCGWLRKVEHKLTSKTDPTIDLLVPQAVPEKHKRRKAVAFEDVQAAYFELAPAYQDVLKLLCATGWHVTELERFVRRDDSEIIRTKREGTLAVLVTWHKTKKWTRTPITSVDALAAAERLKERGHVPRWIRLAFYEACDKATARRRAEDAEAPAVRRFPPGVMRHSVATWAIELGAPAEKVADFLDHADKRTTQRFYADVAEPKAAVSLPELKRAKLKVVK